MHDTQFITMIRLHYDYTYPAYCTLGDQAPLKVFFPHETEKANSGGVLMIITLKRTLDQRRAQRLSWYCHLFDVDGIDPVYSCRT